MMNNTRIAVIASSLLILLYSYTAISKFAAYEVFKATLRRSPLIDQGADTIAWLLPVTELLVVLLLFFERSRRAGLYASAVLLLLFTVYLSYMVLFVPHLPCSCGGVLRRMSWLQHIFFNLFFLILSVCSIYLYRKQERTK